LTFLSSLVYLAAFTEIFMSIVDRTTELSGVEVAILVKTQTRLFQKVGFVTVIALD
jgi:hypothetical protein